MNDWDKGIFFEAMDKLAFFCAGLPENMPFDVKDLIEEWHIEAEKKSKSMGITEDDLCKAAEVMTLGLSIVTAGMPAVVICDAFGEQFSRFCAPQQEPSAADYIRADSALRRAFLGWPIYQDSGEETGATGDAA